MGELQLQSLIRDALELKHGAQRTGGQRKAALLEHLLVGFHHVAAVMYATAPVRRSVQSHGMIVLSDVVSV